MLLVSSIKGPREGIPFTRMDRHYERDRLGRLCARPCDRFPSATNRSFACTTAFAYRRPGANPILTVAVS